jgi:hypothetical protein
VQEGAAGGSITSAGVYTAPAGAGTYHVVARSAADSTKVATATVTVSASTPPPPTTGTQFYVAVTGSDSSAGTEAQPWRTIQKAMRSATPGSTVNVKAGTYRERLSVDVSGTSGNYVTFQPYGFSGAPSCGGFTGVPCGGDQVIIDLASFGNPVTDGVAFLSISGRSHVRVRGFTFQNYTTFGPMQRGVRVFNGANNVEISHNRFLNIKNTGTFSTNALLNFWVEGATTNNITVRGNEFGNIVTARGETLTIVARDVVVEKNWLHDTDHIGMNIGSTSPNAVGVVVRDNLLEWVCKRRDGTWPNNKQCNSLYVNGGSNVVIERNTVRDSGYAYAVVTEPSYPDSRDIIIRNNIAVRTYAGVMLGNWYSSTDGSAIYNVKVLNNTLYGTSQGFVIRPFTSGTVTWKNNIVVSPKPLVNGLGWPVGTMDYNLYSGGTAGPDLHKFTADPQFTNSAAENFTLRATSPAIGGGDPAASLADVGAVDFAGKPRISSGRIEIGAHESN